MLAYLTFLPGLMIGMFALSFVVHWIALLLAALGRDTEGARIPGHSKRAWPLILATVHPVPWLLLLGLPYGIYRLVTHPPAIGWLWFYYGALVGLGGSPLLAIWIWRRNRARAAQTNNVA